MKNSLSLAALIGLILLIWSCSKQSDTTPTPTPITALAITSITPTSGIVGTKVIIVGTGFSAVLADNVVKFGGIAATLDSSTTTRLVTKVPKDAIIGKITVEVGGKSATSSTDFTVNTPTTGIYSEGQFKSFYFTKDKLTRNITWDASGRITRIETMADAAFPNRSTDAQSFEYTATSIKCYYQVPANSTFKNLEYEVKLESNGLPKERTILNDVRFNRNYDYTFDKDGHLLSYKVEAKKGYEQDLSNTLVYTWQNDDLVGLRITNIVTNKVIRDYEFKYDTTIPNTYFPAQLSLRPIIGYRALSEPNDILFLTCGKGPKNALTGIIDNLDKGAGQKKIVYERDNKGRINKISTNEDVIELRY